MAGHVMMFLMNMPVEDRNVLMRHQGINNSGAIAGRPIPIRVEIEQRTVSKHYDWRVLLQFLEVLLQPLDLRFADGGLRVRDVIESDEMHALVIEGIVGVAEMFLIHFATIERGVMLSRHELHGLDLELAHNLLELIHPLATRF